MVTTGAVSGVDVDTGQLAGAGVQHLESVDTPGTGVEHMVTRPGTRCPHHTDTVVLVTCHVGHTGAQGGGDIRPHRQLDTALS